MSYTNVDNPQENNDKTKAKVAPAVPGKDQANDSVAVQASGAADALEELEVIELEELEDIEFLIDEIEDQIAPLAL